MGNLSVNMILWMRIFPNKLKHKAVSPSVTAERLIIEICDFVNAYFHTTGSLNLVNQYGLALEFPTFNPIH